MAVIGRALRVWGIAHGELRLVVQMSSRQTMTVSDLARHELLCCAATPDGNCIIAAGDVTGNCSVAIIACSANYHYPSISFVQCSAAALCAISNCCGSGHLLCYSPNT
jgi:hypothetical protein